MNAIKQVQDREYQLGILLTYGGIVPLHHSNGFGNYDCELQIEKWYNVRTKSWTRDVTLYWFDSGGDEAESEEISEAKAKALFWEEMQREMAAETFGLPDLIDEEVKEIDICTCTMRALHMHGCKCGQIERERNRL